MREFELLPNEEQIRDMAREYGMVKIRKDLFEGSKSPDPAGQVAAAVDNADCGFCQIKVPPCTNNKVAIATIEKCYYLQRDIEQCLIRLHSVSPPVYRANIAELIKIKRENTQEVLVAYTELANQTLDYSPSLYNGRNFCATLSVAAELQEKLLSRLGCLRECTQLMWVTQRELILATALNRMCIFCYFNKL